MLSRNNSILLLVMAVAMLAGIGLFQVLFNNATVSENTKSNLTLSAIPLTDLQGRKTIIADWPQSLLVVNFWAPWCAPCRREIPALMAIQQEYGQQVQVLGLALDSIDNIENFSAEYAMNYPSFVTGADIAMYNAAFNNKSGSLPFTAILDQQRKLQYTHTGEMTAQQLREKIDIFLNMS